MLALAFGVLSLAAALGATAFIAHQRGRGFGGVSLPAIGATHGMIATAGVIILLLAWREGEIFGKGGVDALLMLGAGLLGGLTIAFLAWKRGAVPGGLVLVHALVAGLGYLILAGVTLG